MIELKTLRYLPCNKGTGSRCNSNPGTNKNSLFL